MKSSRYLASLHKILLAPMTLADNAGSYSMCSEEFQGYGRLAWDVQDYGKSYWHSQIIHFC